LAAHWRNGRIKLALARKLLQVRRDFLPLFQHGSYEPLTVRGVQAGHVIAFARTWKHRRLVVAIGRHFGSLTENGVNWSPGCDAVIASPDGTNINYADIIGTCGHFRSNELNARYLFRHMPVAVLRRT
jgi:(1->4)-alpha-D-glucan 1-alpha-D-glucosylmutase